MQRRHLLLGLGAIATTGLLSCTYGPGRGRVPSAKKKKPAAPKDAAEPARRAVGDGRLIEGTKWTTGLNEARGKDHLGNDRRGAVYIPTTYDPSIPAPLVIGIHGAGGDAQVMFKSNGWAKECEAQGWVGIFPNMLNGFELDGERVDPAMIEQDWTMGLADKTASKLNIDSKRIYLVGFSMGGRRAYRLAAAHHDKIAAIAVSGAPMGYTTDPIADQNWNPKNANSGPMSVLHIHGQADSTVPMDGSKKSEGGRADQISTIDGLMLWSSHMKCVETPHFKPPNGCPSHVWGKQWIARSGHEVVGLFDRKLEHQWARAWANPVIVDFFKRVPINS